MMRTRVQTTGLRAVLLPGLLALVGALGLGACGSDAPAPEASPGGAAGRAGQAGSGGGAGVAGQGASAGTAGASAAGGQAGQGGASGGQAGQAGGGGAGLSGASGQEGQAGAGQSGGGQAGNASSGGAGSGGVAGGGAAGSSGSSPSGGQGGQSGSAGGVGVVSRRLAAGHYQSCFVRGDTQLKCWGSNTTGQLGLGDLKTRGDGPGEMGDALPAVDLGGAKVLAVAGATTHTCALLEGGQVKCWGGNAEGQLGLGDTQARGDGAGEMGAALPSVDTQGTVVGLGARGGHTCALLATGALRCWGLNDAGQLGLGDTSPRGDEPSEVGAGIANVDLGGKATDLAVGSSHTCALLEGGQVKCWGSNQYGQLGLGDTQNRGALPGQMGDALPAVELGAGVKAVALVAGSRHTCALVEGGQVKCWGYGNAGQLGLGNAQAQGDKPGEMGDTLPFVDVGAGLKVTGLAASDNHTCAVLEGGQVKCWGVNEHGELGLGDTVYRGNKPGQMGDALPLVELGAGARALSAGRFHTCAWLEGDAVKCWGVGLFGQLGLGNKESLGDMPGEMGSALPVVELGAGP